MSKDDSGEGTFKSFGDLARHLNPEQQQEETEEATKPQKSDWTYEDGAEIGPASESAEAASAARARIERRPPAFEVMTSGPACYTQVDSEELELLHSFRVRTVFPEDVRAEVAGLPADPDPSDFEGRLDLRDQTIFTIDGEDAKDYDDAIGIRDLGAGRLEVGVHIADVAHYVRPATALDDEALARGTSVYLPDQVVPMLPEELSNHLCSLVPQRDRLAYSVLMVFDAQGQRESYRIEKSVIRSAQRNTYRQVQELLDGEDTEAARRAAFLEEPLRLFQKWTIKQQAIRDRKGSLRIQSSERKLLFDEEHRVSAIVQAPTYFSQTLIEETALAANQAVGSFFREHGLPTIYRVHPEKDPEEIEVVSEMLAEHGIRVPDKPRLTGRDIGRLILQARRRPNAEALIQRIMGLVERAVYEVHDHVDEDVATHFGLAREAYLHFTSPIRRYPDLMVHRWLLAVQRRGEEAARELKAEPFLDGLNDIAAHATIQAEVAEMAEKAVGDLKICQYMHPHIGETLNARVQRVSRVGIEILLVDFNVTGFLPASLLGGRIEVKGPSIVARMGRRHRSFTEGFAIAVRLKEVDFLRLQLLLELV